MATLAEAVEAINDVLTGGGSITNISNPDTGVLVINAVSTAKELEMTISEIADEDVKLV